MEGRNLQLTAPIAQNSNILQSHLLGLIPTRVMISRPFVKKMLEKIKEFYRLSKKLKDSQSSTMYQAPKDDYFEYRRKGNKF